MTYTGRGRRRNMQGNMGYLKGTSPKMINIATKKFSGIKNF